MRADLVSTTIVRSSYIRAHRGMSVRLADDRRPRRSRGETRSRVVTCAYPSPQIADQNSPDRKPSMDEPTPQERHLLEALVEVRRYFGDVSERHRAAAESAFTWRTIDDIVVLPRACAGR